MPWQTPVGPIVLVAAGLLLLANVLISQMLMNRPRGRGRITRDPAMPPGQLRRIKRNELLAASGLLAVGLVVTMLYLISR